MTWLKNVIVDVAVTVLIVLAATLDLEWARWIVLVYTPIMVILKLVAFLGRHTIGQLKRKESEVPVWFFHILYLLNVLVAAMDQWWLVAGGWVIIWLLSIATDLRLRPASSS